MSLIKLEIVAENVAEFRHALAGIVESLPQTIPSFSTVATAIPLGATMKPESEAANETSDAPKGEPRRRGRRPKAAGKADPEQVDIEEAIEEAGEQESEEAVEAAAAVSFSDVKDALLALMEKKGDDAPVACLKEFGVSKISALKPEQHAQVVARARAMMDAKK